MNEDKENEYFGSWTHNIANYANQFSSAKPFEHVVIPHFFQDVFAEQIYDVFPKATDPYWHIYHNPIERKKAMNRFTDKLLEDLYSHVLVSESFLQLMKLITNIPNLEPDPHRHGAGCHLHENNGVLKLHLDYMIHPVSGKERRINLIIYMTKNWKEEYGGHLELWSPSEDKQLLPKECVTKILPSFNQAVLFKTSDLSWHGLPNPIQCPSDLSRKSIAIYYVSEPRPGILHPRLKAFFVPLPQEKVTEGLKKLYEIRATRLLTQEDLITYVPEWYTQYEKGSYQLQYK